jgi:hypothetical protein
MTIPIATRSWCPDCQENCTHHSTICTTCGTTLVLRPTSSSSLPSPPVQGAVQPSTSPRLLPPSINALDGLALWNHRLLSSTENTITSNTNNNNDITVDVSAIQNNDNDSNNTNTSAMEQTNRAIASVQLVRQDVQMARYELQQLMSTIRARIVDVQNEQQNLLEALRRSRNELQIWETIPGHLLDPNHPNGDDVLNRNRNPTNEDYLNQIPRIKLQQDCNLFQYASLTVFRSGTTVDYSENRNNTTNDDAIVLNKVEVIPGEFGTHHYNSIYNSRNDDTHFNQNDNTVDTINNNDDCCIQLNNAYMILADPITGKGHELSSKCLHQIQQIVSKPSETNEQQHHQQQQQQQKNENISTQDIVLFFLRGDDVTFVRKAIMGQQASSQVRCVVIGNSLSSSPWPYTMQDSKMEASSLGLSIPVVMTSYQDTQTILQYFSQNIGNNEMSHNDTCTNSKRTMKCTIQIYKQRSDDASKGCIICTDSYRKDQIVLQLPVCKHTFHEECVLQWLRQHNTCPYCRYELPSKLNPNGQKARNDTNATNNSQNSSAFYS